MRPRRIIPPVYEAARPPLTELRSFYRALAVAQGHLAFARRVDGFAENARSFLRGMKAVGVFRFDEVEVELCSTLEVARRVESTVVFAARFGVLQICDQIDQCVHRQVAQPMGSLLDRFDSGF